MQKSKTTRQALDSHLKLLSECDRVTLELYRMMNVTDRDLYLTKNSAVWVNIVKFQEVLSQQLRNLDHTLPMFHQVKLNGTYLNYIEETVYCPRLPRQGQLLFRLTVKLEQ